MTFNTKIRGMRLFINDDGTRAYKTLAMAEVFIPELHMTLHDVRLTWSPDRGFVAHSPSSPRLADRPLIQWFHRGAFARDLTEKLRDMFERMGGEMPEEPTVKQQTGLNAARRFAEKPVRRDHVTGKTIGADPFEQPIERIVVPATFHVHEDASDTEAVEGLARTLSVEHQEAARVLG